MKILITGSNGLLGQKLVKLCLQRSIDFIATSSGVNRNPDCPNAFYRSMDITSKQEVQIVINSTMPSAIIHTAAMTNVDQCEEKPTDCHQINVTGTSFLLAAAQNINAHFQLLSTDFVFDGQKGNYKEDDAVGPLSVYAKSKVDAERLLQSSKYTNWSIVRTSIVYGIGHNLSRSNIILWTKDALSKGNPLSIVDDQFRAPSWADDLALACLTIVERKHLGIFHIAGPVTYSILELVKRMAGYYGLESNNISPVSSNTLNQAAKRPPKTGFDLTKAKTLLGYSPLTIEESLAILDKEIELFEQ